MSHLNIRITGNVQGVSFRYFAFEKARELGISGFAKNEKDGTLYIEAEGDEAALSEFSKWCQEGPPFAKIEKVETSRGQIKNFADFIVEK